MPYVYTHTIVSNDSQFSCELICQQCAAYGENGKQCRRNVCMWLPFCWQHTRRLLGVYKAESRALPGSIGLFADRPFAKGDMIAPYGGERLTEDRVRRRYGVGELAIGPYLLGPIDSACRRYVASASNGAFGLIDDKHANVVFRETMHRFTGPERNAGDTYRGYTLTRNNLGIKWWSVATHNINKGDEIIAHYGDKDYAAAYAKRSAKCKGQCDRTTYVRKRSN